MKTTAKRKTGRVPLVLEGDVLTVEDPVNPVYILKSQLIEGFDLMDTFDLDKVKREAQAAAGFHRLKAHRADERIRINGWTTHSGYQSERHKKIAAALDEVVSACNGLYSLRVRDLGKDPEKSKGRGIVRGVQ